MSVPGRNIHEVVPFRLYEMPCCGHNLCWVNPRSPCFCPECGANVLGRLGEAAKVVDTAILTTRGAS